MSEAATVLDLYRTELAAGRELHSVHVTPSGCREVTTCQFHHRTAALATGFAKLGVERRTQAIAAALTIEN